MNCPEFQTWIDLADGRLEPEAREEAERHLAGGCDACAAALAWYERVLATARADDSVAPPEWVVKRTVGLFSEWREASARRGLSGLVARLRAVLVFDSFASGALELAPSRTSAVSPARQLLYSVAPFDIDLHISPSDEPGRLAVRGQMLSAEGGFEAVGGLVVLVEAGGEPVATTETSEFGEFTFTQVAPGLYELRLVGQGREIHVPSVAIQIE